MNVSGSSSYQPIASSASSTNAPVEKLNTSALGPKIGTGSQKSVYQAKNERDRCIAMFNLGGLAKGGTGKAAAEHEKNMLDKLASHGMPVVKSFGVVECDGAHGLKQELIENALDSADVIHGTKTLPDSKQFNKNLLAGCDDIVKKLQKNNLNVEDLQMLIDKEGNPKISDPRNVTVGNPASGINTVKSLRALALNNALDSDSE